MASFPDLSSLSDNPTIADFMKLPNSSFPYFWAWIIFGIWLIIVSSLYFTEKRLKGTTNILSSMAVACFAILVLSVLGTVFGVITLEVMIYIVVLSAVVIGIWFFS